MNVRILSLVCTMMVTSTMAFSETESEKLDALLKADWEYSMKEFPYGGIPQGPLINSESMKWIELEWNSTE